MVPGDDGSLGRGRQATASTVLSPLSGEDRRRCLGALVGADADEAVSAAAIEIRSRGGQDGNGASYLAHYVLGQSRPANAAAFLENAQGECGLGS